MRKVVAFLCFDGGAVCAFSGFKGFKPQICAKFPVFC